MDLLIGFVCGVLFVGIIWFVYWLRTPTFVRSFKEGISCPECGKGTIVVCQSEHDGIGLGPYYPDLVCSHCGIAEYQYRREHGLPPQK